MTPEPALMKCRAVARAISPGEPDAALGLDVSQAQQRAGGIHPGEG